MAEDLWLLFGADASRCIPQCPQDNSEVVLQLDYDLFLPNPFQFVFNLSTSQIVIRKMSFCGTYINQVIVPAFRYSIFHLCMVHDPRITRIYKIMTPINARN